MSDEDLLVGPALYELHGLIDQLGPGSPETTRRALSMVPSLPTRRRVLDLGCGTGASTLTLAEQLDDGVEVVAVDVHPPYIQRLRGRAKARGLSEKITTRVADMRALGVKPQSFDLVWAEGSLYTIGFAHGCEMCRKLLTPGGAIGVSELVWLVDDPDPEVRAHWAEAYPDMHTREEIIAGMQRHGYRSAGDFVLPRSDWEAYYALVRGRIEEFERREVAPPMRAAIEISRREMDMFARFGDQYGYVFYVATYEGEGEGEGDEPS